MLLSILRRGSGGIGWDGACPLVFDKIGPPEDVLGGPSANVFFAMVFFCYFLFYYS